MKFARFLQETLTPEWKEAYIDYRALKRLLRDIQNAQDDRADATNRPVSMGDLYVTIDVDAALEKQQRDDFKVTLEMPCLAPVKSSNASLSTLLHTPTEQRRMKLHSDIADAAKGICLPDLIPVYFLSNFGSAFDKALSLGDLLSFMPSSYRGFLAAVDAQLEKVEKFYLAREAELQARSATIREQAQELDTHRDDWLVGRDMRLILTAAPFNFAS